MNILYAMVRSLKAVPSARELDEITDWVAEKNTSLKVRIERSRLSESGFWFYDEKYGEIRNKNYSFFQIRGLQQYRNDELVLEQPILVQNEIGYLGIICREKDGILQFLMQAKIEPGNVNKIQISPTIQATKSNFTRKHGGKTPAYLDYFINAKPENIIVDQIQSEQSSRFLGKRNRNIIVMADGEVEVLPSHRWMTLGLIKQLMKVDNLVNMDTRTVLSCIPFILQRYSDGELEQLKWYFTDEPLFRSMLGVFSREDFVRAYHYINDYKMLNRSASRIVPLSELKSWEFTDTGIVHRTGYPFRVIFCDIEIEGREVSRWSQPLFEADGMAMFGLIMAVFGGVKKFLVHAKPEVGCFDGIELAPTVQLEAYKREEGREFGEIDRLFIDMITDCNSSAYVYRDVILSEEGGRFYHEQNRNVVIEVSPELIPQLPDGYFWLDYRMLNEMVQYNNVLNIQLRNLLSLLEI